MQTMIVLPTARHSVPAARHILRDMLTGWGLSANVVGTAELLTSELVGNAILHTLGCPDVRLAFHCREHHLVVEVHDGDPELPAGRLSGGTEEDGRGLLLVEALATDWGTHRTAMGKMVWFALDLREARSPATH